MTPRGRDDPAGARPPHPVLTEYYRRDQDRRPFVVGLFDAAAADYERLCRVMSFGSGSWYRRRALQRLGLQPGMRLLDVATGTGVVARAAVEIVGDPRAVIGLDPSAGMLREARKTVSGPLVRGQVEELPFASASFDVLTIGYALRHAADLDLAFRECSRVLRPGGRILLLEISRPESRVRRRLTHLYLTRVLPMLMASTKRGGAASRLVRYYWDTIATCVPPETIMDALRQVGFIDVHRHVFGGLLSEYSARRPPPREPH